MLVHEVDEQKGGASLEQLQAECKRHCADCSRYTGDDSLAHEFGRGMRVHDVRKNLFADEVPITQWVRERDFQLTSVLRVVLHILQNSPCYLRHPELLEKGVYCSGHLGRNFLQLEMRVYVCPANQGANDISLQLKETVALRQPGFPLLVEFALPFGERAKHEFRRGTGYLPTSALRRRAKKVKEDTRFLLVYLNKLTFTLADTDTVRSSRAASTASWVRWAMNADVPILTVHEQDESKGGCAFSAIIDSTPKDLVRAGPPARVEPEIS